MVQQVGDMWQSATAPTPAASWVKADGALYPFTRVREWGKRMGSRQFPAVPGYIRVPRVPGWWVCVQSNGGAAPPTGDNALKPPRVPASYAIHAVVVGSTAPGNAQVAADCVPRDVSYEACVLATNSTETTFSPLVYDKTDQLHKATFSGVPAGKHRIRIRPVSHPEADYDSPEFTVT